MNNITMKYADNTTQGHQKQKELSKTNIFNIINIVKTDSGESPKKRSMYTSLNSINNKDQDEIKGLSASNSFRPQVLVQQNKKEPVKNKGNNQINIRLNINSEIINNNYPKENTKKATLLNNSSFKEDLIRKQNKTIQELEKEILNTQKLMSKLKQDKDKQTNAKLNKEARSIINMVNYNALLFKTKKTRQLSLSEKLFFQNLMKNSKNLKRKLIRKARFTSPKCFSSTSAYLENESRPNSPFSTHSVQSRKPNLKKKAKNMNSENNNKKISLKANPSNSQMMKNLFLLKERTTKVLKGYNDLTVSSVSNSKLQLALPSKVLFHNKK